MKAINTEGLRTLQIDDSTYSTELTEKFNKRKVWSKPDPKIIFSVMPGTVLQIQVKVGDEVKAGQAYMIIESMKMENIYTFLVGGKVRSINVNIGEKIPKGTLLVELD